MTSPRLALLLASSLGAAGLFTGCAARNYTHYLIEPAPSTNPALVEEEGTQLRPMAFGSTTYMMVSWNDGTTITEVEIPLLASGQRVVIEHRAGAAGVETIPATRLIPPPPTLADGILEQAYRDRGLAVNPHAPAVSIGTARTRMQEALAAGNYQLALEWCEILLARYPSHPETLRAKGSILLLVGERQKAIQIYEAVEEIESDPTVRKKLEELHQQEDR